MGPHDPAPARPLVAITTDLIDRRGTATSRVALDYAARVHAAGATPVFLPPIPAMIGDAIERFDAFVLTGGDDPATEPFGKPTHPKATLIHPTRQRFETTLLAELADRRPDAPVLGICLGMQLMALVAGGELNQHLPDTHPDADLHWEHEHPVEAVHDSPLVASGIILSRHVQAVADPGELEVGALAPDRVIEAVVDPGRAHYLGVQWHPERTGAGPLGQGCFDALVAAIAAPSRPAPASP